MKKTHPDKVGYLTEKIHDIQTNQFAKKGEYVLIKSIDCYYSESDGIYGFFPMYENPKYDEQFLNEESFQKKFNDDFLPILRQRDFVESTPKLIHTKIYFSKGEIINKIIACYDEENQKITALKFRTNRETYIIGRKPDLNKKAVTHIYKDNYFIPGFKTTYLVDKNVPYLSYIHVFYDKDDNFVHYYKAKEPSRVRIFFRKKIKSFVGLFKFLSKILLIMFIFLFPFIYYYYISQNLFGGEIIIPATQGISNPIKIHTDSQGFVHINSNNKYDSYFALGFVHAKERLWQMDFMRRTARGKLSEIFGKKTLQFDKLMRSLGINEMSEIFQNNILENSKYLDDLGSYIKGINYYAYNFILPTEYYIFRTTWESWKLIDTISISNFMSLTLTQDWNMELWNKILEENLGKEFAELVISFNSNFIFQNETIVNDEELSLLKMKRGKEEKLTEKNQESQASTLQEGENLNRKAENEQKSTEPIIDSIQNQGASNAWVISGNYTTSGFPILSNDPHMANSIPSTFFICKIYLPDETIVGGTIPGLPFFFTGSNRHISWGLTSENSDTADICEEKIEDESYIFENEKYQLKTTKEIIVVKDSEDELLDVKWTINGPIITDSFPKELLLVNFDYKSDIPLSLRFSFFFHEFTSYDFFFALNYAKESSNFINELEKHVSPNYNLVYASKSGEIGWFPIGKYPIKNYNNRFCRGYLEDDQVKKYIKRSEMPYLVNPAKGFIVAANNKPVSYDYTYSLQGYYNNIRAFRIREIIQEKLTTEKKMNIKSNLEILKDVKDPLAEQMLPQILKILERNVKNIKNLMYFEDLKKWNFKLSKDSNLPTIWSVLELYIGKQLLTNKLSDLKAKGLMSMLQYWNFISGLIDKIYKGERVDLKQCAHLSGNINCEKYIIYIFTNLDRFISQEGLKKADGGILKWGEVKFNYYSNSLLDRFPILSYIFTNVRSTDGNRNTVKVAEGPFNHFKGSFVSTHSPRLKFVCDLSQSTKPFLIIDGGNSGNMISRFYNNLIKLHEESELIQIDEINFDDLKVPSINTILLRNK